jgi:ABC-type branched-subunit amino acid transport system substrate-binding protein
MIQGNMAADTLLLAGSLSLTGQYAPQGRLAAAGVHQAVQDVRSRGGVAHGPSTPGPGRCDPR